jgi:hypothetical protein
MKTLTQFMEQVQQLKEDPEAVLENVEPTTDSDSVDVDEDTTSEE